MRKINFVKTFKIAVGAMISIIIAQSLGISYSTSAGIITLLSIQNTKKETIFVALRRGLSFITAILVAGTIFTTLGYSALTFGIYLIIFVGLSYALELEEGISVNSVLVAHLLVEKSFNGQWVLNEAALFFIGSSIGVILNLYMPSSKEVVIEFQRQVENRSKKLLENIALNIKGEKVLKEDNIERLFKILQKAKKKAYENMNNTFIGDTQYYIDYIDMRKSQTRILKKIQDNVKLLTALPSQGIKISEFILKISSTYGEHNNGVELLAELNELRNFMRNEPLPINRDEFENRAILFIVLSDLEKFLELKVEFSKYKRSQ